MRFRLQLSESPAWDLISEQGDHVGLWAVAEVQAAAASQCSWQVPDGGGGGTMLLVQPQRRMRPVPSCSPASPLLWLWNPSWRFSLESLSCHPRLQWFWKLDGTVTNTFLLQQPDPVLRCYTPPDDLLMQVSGVYVNK